MISVFIEILLFLFIGIILGIIAGLIPGLHPNTISFLLISIFPFLGIDIIPMVVLLVSAEITNSFVDFIPSILLSAPEEDTALSLLPGQKFLLFGRAYEGIYLTVYGGLMCTLIIGSIFPLFVIFIPSIYSLIKPWISLLLILTILHLFWTQKRNRIYALLIFLFSAIFGLLLFRLPLSKTEVLFPAFCGLFGLSNLFFASSNSELPEQEIDVNLSDCSKKKSVTIGIFSGLISGILPGVGSSEVTVMSQQLAGVKNLKDFMISIGGITTTNSLFSIIALWTIGRVRSGTAAAIQSLSFDYSLTTLFLTLSVILISAGFASLITLSLSKFLIRNLHKVRYNKLTKSIFILLLVLVFLFAGWVGLLIAFTGFSIGVFCIKTGVRRSFMMAVLIVPTILIFI